MSDFKHIAECFVMFIKEAIKNGDALHSYYALFSCGTVVGFEVQSDPFVGFKDGDKYDFPTHRLLHDDGLDGIIEKNTKIFQSIYEKETSESYKQLVTSAYNTFILDGYPYPGGQGADRFAIPLEKLGLPKNTALVLFPYRNPAIINLVVPEMMKEEYRSKDISNIELAAFGGDCRRNDYMEPHLVAVINPDLTVHMI